MKVAIVGSRSLNFDIPEECVPKGTTMIISGAANGIDKKSREFAIKHHILITEILPEYNLYGKAAPLRRNDAIIKYSDYVVVFWDGKSKGTEYVIKRCRKLGKPFRVYQKEDLEK